MLKAGRESWLCWESQRDFVHIEFLVYNGNYYYMICVIINVLVIYIFYECQYNIYKFFQAPLSFLKKTQDTENSNEKRKV